MKKLIKLTPAKVVLSSEIDNYGLVAQQLGKMRFNQKVCSSFSQAGSRALRSQEAFGVQRFPEIGEAGGAIPPESMMEAKFRR